MTIPKPTENTVTTFLAKELEKVGVRTMTFAVLDTPVGRREIDLLCENGGLYACEAKFTERDLLVAISKIQNDYFKYHKDLGIRGGFALLYPTKLSKHVPSEVLEEFIQTLKFKVVMMFLPGDTRKNFTVTEGTITEIAKVMSKHILTPPEFIEPSIEWIIRSLREAAERITYGLKHLASDQLEDLFGGEHVFRSILQYEKEKKYPVEELRLASAYLLLNQILFYHVLSRKARFPEIDTAKLRTPSQLKEYFDFVLDENYKAIFSYNVASRIPKKFTDIIRMIVNVIQGISPEKVGGDLLGTIFHDLIPLEVRKYVAAFYTNVHAADLLAHISIERHDVLVSDFAVGSGGLLVAAYRRKKRLLEDLKEFSEEDHINFIDQLLGIDVMPFAAGVAACHLALQSPEYYTNKIKIAVWDSTELKPNLKIPSIAGLKYVLTGQTQLEMYFEEKIFDRGVIRLGEGVPDEIDLTKCDVIIMNPPFTRQERIPTDYKNILSSRFEEYDDYLHGQLGFYGYFILLADKFLEEGGKLAFVLPAAFLRIKSAEGIRRLLSEKYTIKYVITGSRRLNFSESTWRREILFIAEKSKKNREDTIFVGIEKLPENINDLERFCGKIREIRDDYEDHEISAITAAHTKLEKNLDWFRFIAPLQSSSVSEIWEFIKANARNLEKFGRVYDLGKSMREGIESRRGMKVQAVLIPRSTDRAVRKDDAWVLDEVQEEKILIFNRYFESRMTIPKKCLVSSLRTTSNNRYMDILDNEDFVVVKDFPGADGFFYGERTKLRGVLPAWERYVNDRSGNLIIYRRFVINAPGTFYICHYSTIPIAPTGSFWIFNANNEDAKILCLWFNSSLNLAQIFHERIEDVWIDLHKYTLSNFHVIDTQSLSKEDKIKLLDLFDVLSTRETSSLEEQYISYPELKKEIDVAILSILGFNESQIEDILSELYEALKIQFEALQEMG